MLRLRAGLPRWALFVVVLTAPDAWAATITIGPESSIQQALDDATAGDEVVLLPGTYHEVVLLVDGVDLRASVAGTAIIDAEAEDSVVQAHRIGASTRVEGIIFRNGSASQGGGLFAVASNLTFRNCTFEDNSAVLGGGVSVTQGSEILFDTCTFRRNIASVGGGLHFDFSSATVLRGSVSSNQATSDGAAMAVQNASEALIEDVCLYENHALEGAIISVAYASPTLRNCTVVANEDDAGLGTLALRGSAARIERCIIAFNSGPALRCTNSNWIWVGCNDIFGNVDDSICGDDQGDNLSVDPLFCNPAQSSWNLQSNSPVLGTPCGNLGAHPAGCPALTRIESLSWSRIKREFRDGR